MHRLSGALILALATVADGQAGDLDRFQGTWKIVEDKIDGIKGPSPIQSGSLVVKGDQFTLTEVFVKKGSITLDPSRTPHVREKTLTSYDNQLKTLRAIYQLDEDAYREFELLKGELPTAFPPDEKRPGTLRVWRREGPPREGAAKLKGGLDGTWKLVDITIAGRRWNDPSLYGLTMTVEDGQYTERSEGIKKGIIRLDPSKTPREIDCELSDAIPGKPVVCRGIYRFDGETLDFVLGVTNWPRPAVFDYVADSASHRMKLTK